MIKRIEYEFKTDKNGKEYANQINLKTGKRKRVPLKIAKKRAQAAKKREEKAEKIAELEKIEVKDLAGLSIPEFVDTLAGLITQEKTKEVALSGLCDPEKIEIRTLSGILNSEKIEVKTLSGIVGLEKIEANLDKINSSIILKLLF